MRLLRSRRIRVEYDDGEHVVLVCERPSWSYGMEWAEQWDAQDGESAAQAGRKRYTLALDAVCEHVRGLEDVEDEDGAAVQWPKGETAQRRLLELLFSPSQLVSVAWHLLHEDSEKKSVSCADIA